MRYPDSVKIGLVFVGTIMVGGCARSEPAAPEITVETTAESPDYQTESVPETSEEESYLNTPDYVESPEPTSEPEIETDTPIVDHPTDTENTAATDVLAQFFRTWGEIDNDIGLTDDSYSQVGDNLLGRRLGSYDAWCYFSMEAPESWTNWPDDLPCVELDSTIAELFPFITDPIFADHLTDLLNERVGTSELMNARTGYAEIYIDYPGWGWPAWLIVAGNEQTLMLEPTSRARLIPATLGH